MTEDIGRSVSLPVRAGDDHCPGVLAMHEAEDGLLVRIRLPGGRVSAGQLETVAALAAIGNGLVEITARANLQVRGLPEGAGTTAARLLEEAGLLPSRTHERVRNILASPLAGRHPRSLAATDGVVDDLDRRLCADTRLARLPGRFLFAVDDGSGAVLEQRADVALVACAPDGRDLSGSRFTLAIASRRTTVSLDPAGAVESALEAARAFLELRAASERPVWRVGELTGGAAMLMQRLGLRNDPAGLGQVGMGVAAVGVCEQRDDAVAVTALTPLGRLSRAALTGLAAVARAYGSDVRVSATRTVTIVDVVRDRAESLVCDLNRLGLVTSPGSGWQDLSACAGLGACSKARVDVRAAAEHRAAARAPGAPREHWSACERRCGQPRGVGVSVAAVGDGLVVESQGGRAEMPGVAEALAVLAAVEPEP